MRVSSPSIDGYGELARRVLAHPDWPTEIQPQARSLAALFSKLDRDIELEWLADREAVQRCLALVLGCTSEVVRRAVAPEPQVHGSIRFEDLPYARPFAFRDEALPPGIPPDVLSPSTWGRLWWLAPSGSGRSLVGQWLAARGLARFLSATRWVDVVDRLPGVGPLYLELERGEELDGLGSTLPAGPICVAAPTLPTEATGGGPWTVVQSPLLDEVLPDLLAWIETRLPNDGSFDVAAARVWLQAPLAAGELPTLGAVLGAAGLLDARGMREARGKTLAALAETFVNERLELASTKGSAEAQWLKRFGFDALVALARVALTSSDTPWAQARTQDEWISLIPAVLEPNDSPERAAPPRASPESRGGLARGARPGAYRTVRAFIDAGLLAERTPGRLAVAPEFLKHASLSRARAAIVYSVSPFDWGEALLRPHAAPGVLAALYQRLAADDVGPLERLAEFDAASSPALVVATEAVLVCIGLCALSGSEVAAESVENLWNDQLSWLIELPAQLPRPRLLCCTAADSGPLAQHAVWMLALLAVSELLGERQGRSHPLLRPWGVSFALERLTPVLDAIYAVVAEPDVAAHGWAVEAFALGARLLDSGDADDRADESAIEPSAPPPHPLARPARIARALVDGELDGAWLRGFGAHPLELRALRAACELQRVSWSRMAHALWKNWQSRGCSTDGDRLFAPDAPDAAQFWPHLPPEVMGTAWVRWTSAARWPFEHFGPTQWSAFVNYFADRWRRVPSSKVWLAAFEMMDLGDLQRAVDHGRLLDSNEGVVRALLSCAWRRFPDGLTAKLRECIAGGDGQGVARLLDAAPHVLDADLVRVLSEELSGRSTRRPVIDSARAWSFTKISERRGDWQRAYALLVELEIRLARAERARGSVATD